MTKDDYRYVQVSESPYTWDDLHTRNNEFKPNYFAKTIINFLAERKTAEEINALKEAPEEWLMSLYPDVPNWGSYADEILEYLKIIDHAFRSVKPQTLNMYFEHVKYKYVERKLEFDKALDSARASLDTKASPFTTARTGQRLNTTLSFGRALRRGSAGKMAGGHDYSLPPISKYLKVPFLMGQWHEDLLVLPITAVACEDRLWVKNSPFKQKHYDLLMSLFDFESEEKIESAVRWQAGKTVHS